MYYNRALIYNELVEHFLQKCLGIEESLELRNGEIKSFDSVVNLVRDAERLLVDSALKNESTLLSQQVRHRMWRTDENRKNLRKTIVEELIKFDRLDDDEDIALGVGGAKPKSEKPRTERTAYLVTGLPASGKSSIIYGISDAHGAYIIDPDYTKRKLPEFDGTMSGAQSCARRVIKHNTRTWKLCWS
jgi:hypothetical protein